MKMSGFVVGGLLGAAAAVVLSRGKYKLNLANMGTVGQAIDNAVEAARSKIMAPDKRPAAAGGSAAQNAGGGGAGGLQQVQAIVNKDPALRSEVNQIMKENRESPSMPL